MFVPRNGTQVLGREKNHSAFPPKKPSQIYGLHYKNMKKKRHNGRPTRHEFRYKDSGRPTKLTPELVSKLEQAATVSATIKQSCLYAGISTVTYYEWIKQNPDLLNRLELLRERRPLKANQNITGAIENGDLRLSQWEIERRQSDEYGEKIKVENVGNQDGVFQEDEELRLKFKRKLMENIRRRAQEKQP